MLLILLDGKYADEMIWLQVYKPFDLNMEDMDSSGDFKQKKVFNNQLFLMKFVSKFTGVSYKLCSFDYEIQY